MPIIFKYTYKNYPYSLRATKYSKMLGLLTCNGFYITFTFVFFYVLSSFLCSAGISESVSFGISAILGVLSVTLVRKKIREHFGNKIEAIAMTDSFSRSDVNMNSTNDTFAPAASTTTADSQKTNNYEPSNNIDDIFIDNNEMYIDL